MEDKKTIHLSSGVYRSIQDAIDAVDDNTRIVLDSKVYSESFTVNKSMEIVGANDTVIKLDDHQIVLANDSTLLLDNIKVEIQSMHHDAGIVVSGGVLKCSSCTFTSEKQNRDVFSCVWVEAGSFYLKDSHVDSHANFIKIINGEMLELTNNDFTMTDGNISIETHGMKNINIADNVIKSSVNFVRCTKSVNFIFDNNTISLSLLHGLKEPVFLNVDGLDHGDECQISGNTIHVENEVILTISNSLSMNRKIEFSNNDIHGNGDSRTLLKFDHLQGLIILENNKLIRSKIMVLKCSELLLKKNEIMLLSTQKLNLLMAIDNSFLKHVTIDDAKHVNFKKNSIINDRADCEAIKLTSIDKLIFDQNKISSVDHGITLLNAGDNIEIRIERNEFASCRKRAINIASTMQKKYLKTEVNIIKNIFIGNDKAIYIDDRNLKACNVQENYFDENNEAIIIFGGKSTSNIKVYGNYFEESSQSIELRYTKYCSLSHNELTDSKLSIRGCDEIIISGNHIQKNYYNNGKSLENEVAIKAGGCITVSRNVMLSGKPRHEKKEVLNHLNISSYERQPLAKIFENRPLIESVNSRLFKFSSNNHINRYPDESLLSALRYQIHTEDNLSNMTIDEVLKKDFFKLRESLESIRINIPSESIKQLISSAIDQFQIEIFTGRDMNDIYRFIIKSNETVEMLRLYIGLEDKTDMVTEERIISIMHNYLMIFSKFIHKGNEDEQDKLNAQIKLLENLL